MPIKGKGKSRRRTVTRGPKAQYVPPKKPLWRRRGVQVGALAVLVAGLIAGVVALLIANGNSDRKKEEAAAVRDFSDQVERSLISVGTDFLNQPPLQALTADVSGLRSGKVSSDAAAGQGKSDASNASSAAEAINAVDVPQIIQGHPDLLRMTDSQTMLVQSLHLYQQIAETLQAAAQASGDSRSALLARAQGMEPIALELFRQGYQILDSLRIEFNVAKPQPPAVTQTPPVQTSPPPATTSPVPSPSPKASAKAKATPSARSSPAGKHKKKK